MPEQEAPYMPGSYEKDSRPRDFYAETDEGPKHYDDLTPAQRAREREKQQEIADASRKELETIYDSTNSTAPVNKLRDIVDQTDARLEALDGPTPEDVASARHALGLDRVADPHNATRQIDLDTISPEDDSTHYDPNS